MTRAFNEAGNVNQIDLRSNEQFAAAINALQLGNEKFFAAAWRAHQAIARGE